MRSLWAGVLMALSWTAAATTYRFEGQYYTTPQPPFTTAMQVTGTFSTAQPLPPNMALTGIGPQGANLVTDWHFDDGVTSYTPQNSTVFGETLNFSFQIATDAAGAISDYRIALVSPLPPHALDQPIDAFLIERVDGIALTIVDGASPCLNVDANGVCSATNDQVAEALGGTWVAYEVHRPVPALDRRAQWGMLLAMGLVGVWALGRRTGAGPANS